MSADTVTLTGSSGALKIRLVLPRSLGLRYEVAYAVAESEPRAYCAALGLCSVALQKHVRYSNGNVLAYGASVLEYLLEQGVEYLDVLGAGQTAWVFLSSDLIKTSEVAKAAGFFEESTAPMISPSSESNESGASTPAGS